MGRFFIAFVRQWYILLFMILGRSFFLQNPIDAAKQLVGAYLSCLLQDDSVFRARICELELYTQDEKGCHAFGGKRTARNEAMFLSGGHTYVYLCYGMYNMLNIVLDKEGMAAAVLIRALEYKGCEGPGKLTRFLGITRKDNKIDLCNSEKIWIEPCDFDPEIASGKRIGIDYAGKDAKLPWRFVIKGSPFISKPI